VNNCPLGENSPNLVTLLSANTVGRFVYFAFAKCYVYICRFHQRVFLGWWKKWAACMHACMQGDQIGRIFAQRTNVHFGQLFHNYKSSPHFCATFF
jgi:hypothetical protein